MSQVVTKINLRKASNELGVDILVDTFCYSESCKWLERSVINVGCPKFRKGQQKGQMVSSLLKNELFLFCNSADETGGRMVSRSCLPFLFLLFSVCFLLLVTESVDTFISIASNHFVPKSRPVRACSTTGLILSAKTLPWALLPACQFCMLC